MDTLMQILGRRQAPPILPLKHPLFHEERTDFEHFGLSLSQRISFFIATLCLALLLFTYSLFRIFTALISPSKFAFPYALGNLLLFVNFGFIFGFKSYFKKVFGQSKRTYTSAYLFLTVATIFCALKSGYFVTLGMCLGQIASFGMFCYSFVANTSVKNLRMLFFR